MRYIIKKYYPALILAAGLVLAAAGILMGEPRQAARKAVVICLECIGIG